jgi:type II secretory pathway predicted ATPase ExeA/septal ring-binding cell division protein DamX
MYLEHFGLTEAPFRITPHTDFFFEGANRGATLEALLYAITHDEGIVKVSGEVGSGKTMLCRVLMERLPQNVETIHLANPSLSREEILFTLADELQVNLATNRISAVLRALQEHLIDLYAQGRQVVVLIDEAHAMPAETLEEIRLLSNLESNRHKLLQIVLFGQPELNDILNRNEMRQLKERITHNFTLEPLVRADIAQYIGFRMHAAGYRGPDVFSPAALKLIAAASLGLTRRVNILCDKALLAAFAGNTHLITAAHVRAAIRDADFRGVPAPQGGLLLGGVAALLLIGAGLAYFQFGAPAQSGQSAGQAAPASAAVAAPSAAQVSVPATPTAMAASKPAPEQDAPVTPATAPEAIQAGKDPQSGSEAVAAPAAAATDVPPPGPATGTLPVAEPPVAAPPVAAPALSQPAAEDTAPPAPGYGRLTRQRLEETRKWLDATADNRWFIQLLSTDAGGARHVEGFIAKALRVAEDADAIRAYTVENKGALRLGVIYGEYPSREAASRALGGLPAALRLYGPYPRQVGRLRD